MTQLSFWLFLWVSINFFAMAAAFFCAKDGKLRVYLVFFLVCLGIASALRMFTDPLVEVLTPDGLQTAVPLVVLAGQIGMIVFWMKHYGKR